MSYANVTNLICVTVADYTVKDICLFECCCWFTQSLFCSHYRLVKFMYYQARAL